MIGNHLIFETTIKFLIKNVIFFLKKMNIKIVNNYWAFIVLTIVLNPFIPSSETVLIGAEYVGVVVLFVELVHPESPTTPPTNINTKNRYIHFIKSPHSIC